MNLQTELLGVDDLSGSYRGALISHIIFQGKPDAGKYVTQASGLVGAYLFSESQPLMR